MNKIFIQKIPYGIKLASGISSDELSVKSVKCETPQGSRI